MDALVAYRLACADAEYVRAEWLAAGSPLVVDHGNGASGVSPLWKCVGDADDRVARRARDLRPLVAAWPGSAGGRDERA